MPLVADKIICDPYFSSLTDKNRVGMAPYEWFHILFSYLPLSPPGNLVCRARGKV